MLVSYCYVTNHPEIQWLHSKHLLLCMSLWISSVVLLDLSVLLVCLQSAMDSWVGSSADLD